MGLNGALVPLAARAAVGFEHLFQPGKEARRICAVHGAMVARQVQPHHLTHTDTAGYRHDTGLDGPHGQQGAFGRIDNGLENRDAELPQRTDGKSA